MLVFPMPELAFEYLPERRCYEGLRGNRNFSYGSTLQPHTVFVSIQVIILTYR
jgi:hypothetical protein